MTPAEATKYFGSKLTEFERAEIEKYSEIWYLGLSACKIHGEEGASQNGGYDDDNGSYNKVLHDHISYRYIYLILKKKPNLLKLFPKKIKKYPIFQIDLFTSIFIHI